MKVVLEDIHLNVKEIAIELPVSAVSCVLKEKVVINGNPHEVDPTKVDVVLECGSEFRLDISDGFNPWGR